MNVKPLRCRACDFTSHAPVLLQYDNMPATAQGFPSLESLESDHGEHLEVLQCPCCGMVQLSNSPVSYYRDVIRAAAFSPEMGAFRLNQFQQWASKYHLLGQHVLEIGCGKGEYLALLQEAGVQAFGIEHALDAVTSCQQAGLRVAQGYLGDEAPDIFTDAKFDGFVCLNFMEHWPQPRQSLHALWSILNDDAIGLIEVPNFDMIVQKGLFSEFIADHLLYFTEQTLKVFLENNGFEVLDCQPVWQDYILSAVVRKRKVMDLSFFSNYRETVSQLLHGYIDRFADNGVAIWGAGHQSLAVIALAGIAHRVEYVVDSATFKQGRFTPASHLPIVSPQQLETHPVKALIVMAASYSDEVARIVRTKYRHIRHVAILREAGLEEV